MEDKAENIFWGAPRINIWTNGLRQVAVKLVASTPLEAKAKSSMREDLPCDDPLPKLWSISLAPGGDIVDGGPCLKDFVLLESFKLGASCCWRVKESGGDDSITHHVLCETR